MRESKGTKSHEPLQLVLLKNLFNTGEHVCNDKNGGADGSHYMHQDCDGGATSLIAIQTA